MVVAFQIPSADTNAKTSFCHPLLLTNTTTHTHWRTLNRDPGAFLIEAKWFVCFYSSNENRLSGIYTSSADLATYTFPSCLCCSLAKTDMWKGPEFGFQTATRHEHYLGVFGSPRHHGKRNMNSWSRKAAGRYAFYNIVVYFWLRQWRW